MKTSQILALTVVTSTPTDTMQVLEIGRGSFWGGETVGGTTGPENCDTIIALTFSIKCNEDTSMPSNLACG